jgi:hypothetical protein
MHDLQLPHDGGVSGGYVGQVSSFSVPQECTLGGKEGSGDASQFLLIIQCSGQGCCCDVGVLHHERGDSHTPFCDWYVDSCSWESFGKPAKLPGHGCNGLVHEPYVCFTVGGRYHCVGCCWFDTGVDPFPDELNQGWVDHGGGGLVSLPLCIGEVQILAGGGWCSHFGLGPAGVLLGKFIISVSSHHFHEVYCSHTGLFPPDVHTSGVIHVHFCFGSLQQLKGE